MQSTTALILITVIGYTTVVANESQVERHQETFSSLHSQTEANPVLHVAKGLNEDGTLVKYYRRGLDYAINYFGNYGPYHVYLLGPEDKKSILNIYRERAKSRINPNSTILPDQQIKEYLRRPNVINEIQAVLEGKAEGGLTWSKPPGVFMRTSPRIQLDARTTQSKTPGEHSTNIITYSRLPIAIHMPIGIPTETSVRGCRREWPPTVQQYLWNDLV